MSEIKPPIADVVKFRGKDYKPNPNVDIEKVREDLLSLANDIDKIASYTKWPGWCDCQANSMRDFAKDLK